MRIVVDNSTGGDPQLAASVADGLRAAGHDVELREPRPESMYDTAIHLVATGIVVRLAARPPGGELGDISAVVRAALARHPSPRRRTRAVPVAVGEGGRIITWVDVFD